MSGNWEVCVLDKDYEICTEYPYQVRKIKTGRIIKEHELANGYIQCKMNQKNYYKHRIVATQFIDNPNGYEFVDHWNKVRTDNHVENLRWVSASDNSKNRIATKSTKYTLIEYGKEPDDLIEVNEYSEHQLDKYYYSPEKNRFYFDSGVDYRELHINFSKSGSAFVNAKDINKNRVWIYFNKFKSDYDLD